MIRCDQEEAFALLAGKKRRSVRRIKGDESPQMKNKVNELKATPRRVLPFCLIGMAVLLAGFLFLFRGVIGRYHQWFALQGQTGGRYTIADDFTGEQQDKASLGSFFEGKEELLALKDFSDELENHADFSFISIYENPLNGPLENSHDIAIPNSVYAYGEQSVNGSRVSVRALLLNPDAAEFYRLNLPPKTLQAGEQPGEIPVLLGSSYQGVYAPGDSFPLEYFGMEFTAAVQQILPEGACVEVKKQPVILDDYLLVPFVDCPSPPTDPAQTRFQAISYSSRVNGDAVLDQDFSFGSLRKELKRLTSKYGLPEMMYYQPLS